MLFSRTAASALLLFAAGASAIKGDSWCGSVMCVTAYINETQATYEMVSNLGESQFGWMAIGFGNKMVGSPMVIMWPNRDGSLSVSHRLASGHAEPSVDNNPPRIAQAYLPLSSQTADETHIAFTIPLNRDVHQNIIWAIGTTRPSSGDAGANLVKHISSGTVLLDLSQELVPAGGPFTPTTPPGGVVSSGLPRATARPTGLPPFVLPELLPYQRLLIGHAVLCSLGFIVILPLGALIGRYLRTFSPKWFKAHWTVQACVASPLIATGFALAVVSIVEKEGDHFDDRHKISGMVLIVLYVIQILLGTVIHWFKPKRTPPAVPGWPTEQALVWTRHSFGLRPIQNYLHAVLGLAIIGLAFYTVRRGFEYEWPESTGRGEQTPVLFIVWVVWLSVVGALYFGGLGLLPRQFRLEWRNVLSKQARGDKNDSWQLRPTISAPVRQNSGKSVHSTRSNHAMLPKRYEPQSPPRTRAGSPDSMDARTDESSKPIYRTPMGAAF